MFCVMHPWPYCNGRNSNTVMMMMMMMMMAMTVRVCLCVQYGGVRGAVHASGNHG